MSLQELHAYTPEALQEFLQEGLNDIQISEYLDYARELQRIEHADFVAREAQAHFLSLENYAAWLEVEIEGADLCAAMIADHRRRNVLCLSEINRRERLKRLPHNPKFQDYQAEFADLQRRGVEIISTYTELKKVGKEYLGKCIFHNDKTPSLRVNEAKGLWYCFGCNQGGNVYDFVERARTKAITYDG